MLHAWFIAFPSHLHSPNAVCARTNKSSLSLVKISVLDHLSNNNRVRSKRFYVWPICHLNLSSHSCYELDYLTHLAIQ